MHGWKVLPILIAAGCGAGSTWPSPPAGFGDADQVATGRHLFEEHCAICHGESGDGHGQRHSSLSSEPPDFNQPDWQGRRSAGHVYAIIQDGKRGTSMPAWVGKLSSDQIWAITASVKSRGPEPR